MSVRTVIFGVIHFSEGDAPYATIESVDFVVDVTYIKDHDLEEVAEALMQGTGSTSWICPSLYNGKFVVSGQMSIHETRAAIAAIAKSMHQS